MARRLRIEYPGAYYHIMNRGRSYLWGQAFVLTYREISLQSRNGAQAQG